MTRSSEAQVQGFLPVKVNVPLGEYRRLFAEAQERGTTVAELIMHRAVKPKRGGFRAGSGRKSKYMPSVGRRIAEARAAGMTWPKVAAHVGIAIDTARRWLAIYENEKHGSAGKRSS
ncbi:helix-turn-helix domain-containing protein [Microbacterium sp.]|uniref:helix-turn-helix domain-containing protein n=1 Tax=Microbacterium sp. TaxID=51671 RepID=UPI003A8F60E0